MTWRGRVGGFLVAMIVTISLMLLGDQGRLGAYFNHQVYVESTRADSVSWQSMQAEQPKAIIIEQDAQSHVEAPPKQQSSYRQVPLFSTSSGIVDMISVKPGDEILITQVIGRMANQYHELLATVSGRVLFINVTGAVEVGQIIGAVVPASPPAPGFRDFSSRPLIRAAPVIHGNYCNEEDEDVRAYYLHPDRILNNGAPCLPSTLPFSTFSQTKPPPLLPLEFLKSLQISRKFNCEGSNFRVATGANSRYFANVLNLIGSIHFWEPNISVIVYDMGLNTEQLTILQTIGGGVSLRRLPFESLPPYFQNLHTYAFKSFLLFDTVRSFPEECIIWQDAGQEFRSRITSIRRILERKHVFLVKTDYSHPTRYTHPSHLSFFLKSPEQYINMTLIMKRNPEYKGLWEAAGGIIGLVKERAVLERIFLPWLACSFYRQCISPIDTDRYNDRQDQTALNMILYYNRWPDDRNAPSASKMLVDGHAERLVPELGDTDEFSVDGNSAQGRNFLTSDHTVIVPGLVLFSRKENPPYPFHQYIKYKQDSRTG